MNLRKDAVIFVLMTNKKKKNERDSQTKLGTKWIVKLFCHFLKLEIRYLLKKCTNNETVYFCWYRVCTMSENSLPSTYSRN